MNVILPGLAISIAVSLISQFLAHFLPTLGAAIVAIALGMLAGNTFLKQPQLHPGTKFAEKRLLEFAIILNGLTLDFQMMKQIGFKGIVFIITLMMATIIGYYLLGRLMNFNKILSLLMAAGNAVCGTSAIGTVSPILDAKSKDKGMSIASVNLMGTVLMLLLPVVAALIYGSETLPTAALIGGSVQAVGQVIASAKLVNDDVVHLATVFKLLRVIMITFVALIFSKLNLAEDEPLLNLTAKKSQVAFQIPWFIIGFLLLFIIRNLNILPVAALSLISSVRSQFEIIALAAIGLRINFSEIASEGPRVLIYGLLGSALQVILAIGLIALLF